MSDGGGGYLWGKEWGREGGGGRLDWSGYTMCLRQKKETKGNQKNKRKKKKKEKKEIKR